MGLPAGMERVLVDDLDSSAESLNARVPDADTFFVLARSIRPNLKYLVDLLRRREKELENAQANRKPLISFDGSHSLTHSSPASGGYKGWTGSYDLGFTLSFPVFDGFELASLVRQAESALEGARYDEIAAWQALVKDIQTARMQILKTRERITVSQKIIDNAGASLDLALKAYENGIGSIRDVTDAQTQIADARRTYVSLLLAYHAAWSRIEFLLGLPQPHGPAKIGLLQTAGPSIK